MKLVCAELSNATRGARDEHYLRLGCTIDCITVTAPSHWAIVVRCELAIVAPLTGAYAATSVVVVRMLAVERCPTQWGHGCGEDHLE